MARRGSKSHAMPEREERPAAAPRADFKGWLVASLGAGAAVGVAALAASWRPLPGLPAPPGPLAEHALAWAREAAALPFPRMFARPRADYADFWRGLSDSGRFAIEWRASLATLLGALPGTLMWGSFMRRGDGVAHLRGGRRWERPHAAPRLAARLAGEFRLSPGHEVAPGVPYPSTMWTRHVLLAGGTGAGKSTVLRPLIDKIVAAREPLLLFDPKGEFTAQWPGLAILAPWDERSLAWDVAADLRGLGEARKFAEALVVGGGNDPMWANAARQILVGLLMRLKSARGTDWGWADLASLLAAPLPEIAEIIAESHPEALRSVEKASVTTQGILINLASFCAPVFDLARAWGSHPPERRVSFSKWARGGEGPRQIALQGHESYSELGKCYVRGIFEAVSSALGSAEAEDDESRALWIVADEFAMMGAIPIRSLFAAGRSRGVRCVLAFQDSAQIEEVHGEKLARSMLSMCGTLIVGQIQQGETADALAKRLGSREVERPTATTTVQAGGARSETFGRAREESALYKPSELGSRLGPTRDREGVVCALVAGGQAYELFWPMHPRRRLRPQSIPAAWIDGASPFVPLPPLDVLEPGRPRPARQANPSPEAESALVVGELLGGRGAQDAAGSPSAGRAASPRQDDLSDLEELGELLGLDGEAGGGERPEEAAEFAIEPALAERLMRAFEELKDSGDADRVASR